MQLKLLFDGNGQGFTVDYERGRLIGRHHFEVRQTMNDQRLNAAEVECIASDSDNTTSWKHAAGDVFGTDGFSIARDTQRVPDSIGGLNATIEREGQLACGNPQEQFHRIRGSQTARFEFVRELNDQTCARRIDPPTRRISRDRRDVLPIVGEVRASRTDAPNLDRSVGRVVPQAELPKRIQGVPASLNEVVGGRLQSMSRIHIAGQEVNGRNGAMERSELVDGNSHHLFESIGYEIQGHGTYD